MTWQPIENPPPSPMGVLFYIPSARQNVPYGQDFSVEIGSWDGHRWLEQGTGHDMDERRDEIMGCGSHYPTYWQPLPATHARPEPKP